MQCIFCKKDSTESRSVEHIIPESLWNTKQILPPGIVCDKCNNYFSRKVEKPFLCSTLLKELRFHQAIPSKKGRIPSVTGMISGSDTPVKIHRKVKGNPRLFIDLNKEQFEMVLNIKTKEIYLPLGSDIPSGKGVSRFLAKIALEALAQKFMHIEGGIDYIVEESQFDPIRNHAKIGQPQEWKYHSRRIYDANKQWERDGKEGQLVHEYDFLHTEFREVYFVLALYGIEFTFNMAGPDVDGYIHWLEQNKKTSPLYHGKNG